MPPAVLAQVLSTIKDCTSLVELDLTGNEFGDASEPLLQQLSEYLTEAESLQKCSLKNQTGAQPFTVSFTNGDASIQDREIKICPRNPAMLVEHGWDEEESD